MRDVTAASLTSAGPAPDDRILALDVLRGLALFGMLVVHIYDATAEATGVPGTVRTLVEHLVSERAYATFALLFGAGFAVQLERTRRRGVPFGRIYLRRLAVLAIFGVIAHGVFGYNVLLGYAVWGLVLLPLERLRVGALVAVLLLTTFDRSAYTLARGLMQARTHTAAEIDESAQKRRADFAAGWKLRDDANEQPTLAAAIPYRARHMAWFYRQSFFLYFPFEVPLFICGLLAVRLGLFERPREHRRLIGWMMATGLAAWATAEFVLPMIPRFEPRAAYAALTGLPLSIWLMLFYVGAALLLLGSAPRAARWLGWFSWPGRAALTNYFIQIITIDFVVSRYGLGLGQLPAWAIVPASLAFYAVVVIASRLWFIRYRFGPLEWVWRTLTYGRRPQFRRSTATVASQGIPAAEQR